MSLPNPINVTYVSPLISDTFPFQYIVKDTDNIINIDTTHGEVHVILRNIRNSGMLQYQPLLSINDGGNNASVNNITIYPSGGDIINDNTEYVLNNDGANSIIQISDVNQYVVLSSQSGGGTTFGGTNYIYVYANGTDTENATELQTAYDLAKTMSPSATNRITIVCGVGYYNFSSSFLMDTDYINVVSLDGNRSIIFNGLGSIIIQGDYVFVKGIDVQSKSFDVGTSKNNQLIYNCKGGDYSLGANAGFVLSGTFIDCEMGNYSFAGAGSTTLSGVFTNCIAGTNSFGQNFSSLFGLFTNCKANNNSFGLASATLSGTFEYCVGGDTCFGSDSEITGIFSYCKAGLVSFGGNLSGNNRAKLYNCRLTKGTFKAVGIGGVTIYCINGSNSPDNQGFLAQNKV